MLDNDFMTAFSVKRNLAGEQFIQHDSEGIDIDLAPVLTAANLRRHVMKCTYTFGMSATMRSRNELTQPVVANLDGAQIIKNIAWL